MFLKRFFILLFLTAFSPAVQAGLELSTKYVSVSLPKHDKPVQLVNYISIGPKNSALVMETSDSLFRSWKISGAGGKGSADLFVSKERGIGWIIALEHDTIKVLIARDYKNTNDPRLISMSTNFISGLFILENNDPDCNSYFSLYSVKNSWDADVEYTGKYALYVMNSEGCEGGNWKAKTSKLKVPEKVLYAAIFTAINTQNIRHLFKGFVL